MPRRALVSAPRYVDENSVTQRNRNRSSDTYTPNSISEDQLLACLARLIRKVSEIEAKMPGDYVEFNKTLTVGGTVTLPHQFNAPVRYYVTTWTRSVGGAYPTTNPVLVMDAASDQNNLVLQSQVAGRAIIRVERASRGLSV